MTLDPRVPSGPLPDKWNLCRGELRLISPANRRNFHVLVVGAGLAGGSAATALAEHGYRVTVLTILDSPRRSHSVAAQGGINAAKNAANDGDSVWRMFQDTLRGGDFRGREASIYRLAQLSSPVIDMLVAQGVPFAREYGGGLRTRSFGGVQVSRTFYARGQTGQQLLVGVYGALMRQVEAGRVRLLPRREMLDLVVTDGRAVGIVARDLLSGELERHAADAVVIATGGYSTVYHLSTNALNSNASAIWRCHKRGALFANPSFTQFHPTSIPQLNPAQRKLTLMSESLRNDGRMWVPQQPGDRRAPADVPEAERDYFLERIYPAYGNLVPRDVASRACRSMVLEGRAVGSAVYLDFGDAVRRVGRPVLEERYGNLFAMYHEVAGENPLDTPMLISPAPHFTMGGLWVDYHLRTSVPALFAIGEANCADHGANRLGANSLLQTMVDGAFVLPATLPDELARLGAARVATSDAVFADAERACREQSVELLARRGSATAGEFHRLLGELLIRDVGVSRTPEALTNAVGRIRELQAEFARNLQVSGPDGLNAELERAGRVADFLELAELMAVDALAREESCGAHFREDHQGADGSPLRNDERFACMFAWQWSPSGPALHREELQFESGAPVVRNYAG